ncbi:ABC transporter permease [Catellatospora bangladeshensis]|uniref:Multidrug ABC transporter permease n=1 Tax=Catellatospora bangladeshensis TaxID=310355 RepID=A0A8J3JS15_9ACTN|nr:ABC transporter permease [Catellatospora bangladeshensis]GIF85966.1 multidrug ABC transporter permease [Catellatospora bangladeshensis]
MRHALRVIAAEALKQHRRSFGRPLVVASMLLWPVLQLAATYYTMLPVLDTPGIASRWPDAAQPARLLAFLAAGAFAYLFYFSLVQSAWHFSFERISGTIELLFLSPASRLALVFANGTGALVQNTWLAGCFAVAAASAGGALHVAHPGMYAVAALALVVPAIVWGAFLNSLLVFSRDSAFLYTLLDDPLWFVSGVRLPLFAMPLAIKAVGLAFPLTSSLIVLRGALLDAQPLSALLEPLALLTGLCALLFAATAALLRLGEARAQRTGSMQLY